MVVSVRPKAKRVSQWVQWQDYWTASILWSTSSHGYRIMKEIIWLYVWVTLSHSVNYLLSWLHTRGREHEGNSSVYPNRVLVGNPKTLCPSLWWIVYCFMGVSFSLGITLAILIYGVRSSPFIPPYQYLVWWPRAQQWESTNSKHNGHHRSISSYQNSSCCDFPSSVCKIFFSF